jgi:small subunit ribosomal protein S13
MAEFRYIVRIASVDIDGSKDVAHALTGIEGVGYRLAVAIADRAGVEKTEQIGLLEDGSIAKLEESLRSLESWLPQWMMNRRRDMDTGKDMHLFGSDLAAKERDDVNYLRKIRAYRGIRHETGPKVRGQRTRSKGRTGLSIGVSRRREE